MKFFPMTKVQELFKSLMIAVKITFTTRTILAPSQTQITPVEGLRLLRMMSLGHSGKQYVDKERELW